MKPNIAQPLADMAENFDQIIEATAGYRARCEAAGFSPTAAEQLALDFHRLLFAQITAKK